MHLTMLLACAIILVFLTQSFAEAKTTYEAQTKLTFDIGKTYLSNVAPTPIKLRIGMSYICGSYDSTSHVLTSRVYQRFLWVDGRVTWNPHDYDGLNIIRVPIAHLWSPDIKLFNAFDQEQEIEKTNAIILSNGTILWVPPTTLKTYCQPATKNDKIHCKLILGSWTFSKTDIELELFKDGFDTEMYLDECPYVVSQSSAVIVERNYALWGTYPRLEVSFDIEPRPHVKHHSDVVRDTRERRRPLQAVRKDWHSAKCIWPRCS